MYRWSIGVGIVQYEKGEEKNVKHRNVDDESVSNVV